MLYSRTITVPYKWTAGYHGDEAHPFYFNCARCNAEAPDIAGFFTTDDPPTWEGMAVLGEQPPFKLAMYCTRCWQEVKDVGPCESAR